MVIQALALIALPLFLLIALWLPNVVRRTDRPGLARFHRHGNRVSGAPLQRSSCP